MISVSLQAIKTVLTAIRKRKEEITLESISQELTCNPSLGQIAEIIHFYNLQSHVSGFFGSTYITPQAEYIYNFLKMVKPDLEVIHNKKIAKLTYLQLYIPEKDTCILIDYEIPPKMTSSKIIKIDRKDFSSIFSLSRTKLLLTNELHLEKRLMLENSEIDILDYIQQNKDLTHKELDSKLYVKLLNKMIRNTDISLQIERTNLFSKGVSDFKYMKIKEDVLNTKKHLQNLTSHYDDIKGGTIFE